jgi:hypothetical protein
VGLIPSLYVSHLPREEGDWLVVRLRFAVYDIILLHEDGSNGEPRGIGVDPNALR